ncbi:MdtA/MuxA family multidrug efflux RND transporter periplasmic adaptor subunit [Labrys wisconsinensis]|uniref:Multidrug efflux system membrane fusion protein n=1 Tax=Labrys wisconsinensis TaxID=425677 RepID=A0ABU0JNS4_9HYPH|nr:MdtA/MuxA family multidrug efflux RND transporter periplasmic adaptor subunit [Labrys wisconsinensis]MDQ0475141.1 multidrug efflux system membrane fusion protein [Labrys wisconsinensis]
MDERVDLARSKTAPLTVPLGRPKPPRRRGIVKWLLALVVGIACLFAWEQLEKPTPEVAPSPGAGRGGGRGAGLPPQTIRDAEAAKGDIPLVINALGTVTSLATVTVRTQIAGTLQQIGFTEGQMVKAGDFLAQIDQRPYQATLEQYQGQLAKDTALLAQAQADLARYQKLGRQDSIATQQIDDQKFLVTQDQAAISTDQAQIDAAKLNIAYCHIVAPVGGRVGLRQVDAGNYVQVTDTNGIVIITEIQPMSVIFSTPEDNLSQIAARLKSGASLPVTVFDRANVKQLATGSVSTTDNQIDTTTGTFKIRAMFANDDGALFPNQFVNVSLLVDTLRDAVVVPNAAVQLGPQGNFAYVVKDDDTVTVRKIVIGPADADHTAITSGLAVGEKVVIDGADRLREGAKVQVRNGSGHAGTGGAAPAPDGQHAAPGQDPGQAGQHKHRRPQGQDQGAPAPGP